MRLGPFHDGKLVFLPQGTRSAIDAHAFPGGVNMLLTRETKRGSARANSGLLPAASAKFSSFSPTTESKADRSQCEQTPMIASTSQRMWARSQRA